VPDAVVAQLQDVRDRANAVLLEANALLAHGLLTKAEALQTRSEVVREMECHRETILSSWRTLWLVTLARRWGKEARAGTWTEQANSSGDDSRPAQKRQVRKK